MCDCALRWMSKDMSPVHPLQAFHLLWGRVSNSPLHLPAWVAHKLSEILLAPSLILYRRAGITETQYLTPFYMGSVDPTRVLLTQCKSFAHQDSFPDPNSGRKWQTFPQRLLHFTSLLVNVVRLLISPPPCQTYYVTLITSYLCGCGMVSLCGFDFHFPND